ncbi:MAG TPA: hypothetical protein VGQ42_01395 [Candidatus Dormibacteraeota bacterium]|jgi:hypothetical protein|nr:hypothetical protein [Candidatus Dormibacteraeota bacterium]
MARVLRAVLPPLGFAVAALVFFAPQLIGRNTVIPWDVPDLYYPNTAFVVQSWHQHQMPLWSPYVFSGFPIGGDPLSMPFYPPNILAGLLLPGGRLSLYQFEFLLVFHTWVAAYGAYRLALQETQSRVAAVVAGLAFGFGGYISAHAQHYAIVVMLAWLPWAVLLIARQVRTGRLRDGVLAGAAVAMMVLSGAPQLLAYSLVFVEAFAIVAVLRLQGAALATRLRRLGGHWAAMGFGAVLALPQLLATTSLSAVSTRATLTYADTSGNAQRPTSLISLLFPHSWTTAPYDPTEWILFVGILPLLAAAVALVFAWRRSLFWAVGALVTGLLALGDLTPLHRIEYTLLPYAHDFRRPSVWMGIASLCLVILAAHGIAAAIRDRRARWLLAAGCGLTAVAYGILGLARHSDVVLPWFVTEARELEVIAASSAVLALAFLVLRGRVRATVVVVASFAVLAGTLGGREFNAAPLKPVSVIDTASIDGDVGIVADLHALQNAGANRAAFVGMHAGFLDGPNATRLYSIWGYDQLRLRDYQAVVDRFSAVDTSIDDRMLDANFNADSPLLRMLGVSYVVTEGGFADGHLNMFSGLPEVPVTSGRRVFRVPDAVAKAFCPARFEAIAGRKAALDRLSMPGFDPRVTALVAGPALPPAASCSAQLLDYGAQSLSVQVDATAPATLVVSDVVYPGWTATVDGNSAPIETVDTVLRGVRVPAGKHVVAMSFTDRPVRLAALGSVVALIVALLACAIAGFRRGARPWCILSRKQASRGESTRPSTAVDFGPGGA